jgi:hypothetical protein
MGAPTPKLLPSARRRQYDACLREQQAVQKLQLKRQFWLLQVAMEIRSDVVRLWTT